MQDVNASTDSILFLDTETTGLKPGFIGQLAAIKLVPNGDDFSIETFVDWYIVQALEYGAAKVNGFDVRTLAKLSGGKTFSDKYEDWFDFASDVTVFYGYNVAFDIRFVNAELARVGYAQDVTPCDVLKFVKADNHSKDGNKLSDAIDRYGIEAETEEWCNALFTGVDYNIHDARYDVVATFLLAQKLGMIPSISL
jgi:DNA polymerase-3 subunit epsilon